ncbi:MAG: lysozyme [Fusobacteriaceae bacterium]
MKISQKGIDLIKNFEGCRLVAYKCPAGVWTCGFGTTLGVTPGMVITQRQAEKLLENDLIKFEVAVESLVEVLLTQEQFDSLVSFAYNVGNSALKKSTLLQKLNKGDYKGASEEFLRWNKAAGKVLPGLVKRRLAEQKLFNNT